MKKVVIPLNSYRLEIFNNECMPSAMTVQCFAYLDQDVSAALPYLNAVLGGFEYIKEPPSVTFRAQGKLITVHKQKIAINALKNENEARKIVEWIIREINDAWEKRYEIVPCYDGTPNPKILEILKLLPKTNCGECGSTTCMVFACLVAKGRKNHLIVRLLKWKIKGNYLPIWVYFSSIYDPILLPSETRSLYSQADIGSYLFVSISIRTGQNVKNVATFDCC